ncbi:MAG: hypothetical protein Q9170_007733, partial [Blastenia crenularia]
MSPVPTSTSLPPSLSTPTLSSIPNPVTPSLNISPIAIIICWVLTAFLPIPLIITLVFVRYFPNVISALSSPNPLRSQRLGKEQSRPSLSSDQAASTPSSRTLTVSNTSPQTSTEGQRPSPPFEAGISKHDFFNQATPRNSLPNIRMPSRSNEERRSVSTDQADQINPDAIRPLPAAFESPRPLSFLKPLSLPSTPQKRSYIPLGSGNPLKPSVNDYYLQRGRLKRRCLVSAILLGLIVGMYVLEGFAIAAAQTYAHARVLSRPSGKGGVGAGKEDERWLIPWVIYVVLEGGLVVACAWMVFTMRRQIRLLDQKRVDEKGKGVDKPGNSRFREADLPADQTEGETDGFLPRTKIKVGEGHPADEGIEEQEDNEELKEEEPEWQTLRYHPTFDSSHSSMSASSQPPRCSTSKADPNGESSTHGFYYSPGRSTLTQFPISSLPSSSNPTKANSGSSERLNAENASQQKDSSFRQWSWGFEDDVPTEEQPLTTLREAFLGRTDGVASRNSWAQDDEEEFRRDKGKSKGKTKEEPADEEIELTTQVPREFLTGIDLGKKYAFTD